MRRIWALLTRRGRSGRVAQPFAPAAGVQERIAAAVEPDPTPSPAPAPPFPDPTPTPDPSPPTPHPQPSPPRPPQPEPVPEAPSPGPEAPPLPEGEEDTDPRAGELRARLAEAKAAGIDREEFESGETPVDAVETPIDIEARRQSVHQEARAALDEMRGGPGDSAA